MVVWQPFYYLAFNHCACLRNARRISYKKSSCGIFTSSEHPQQNKTSPSPYSLLILPEFHSVSRCEGRKCIVLGLYNVSLFSSLSHFLLLFVPQYGRLAASYPLLALNHCACLRNARRISYLLRLVGYLHQRNINNKTRPLHLLSLFSSYLSSIVPVVAKGESVSC
jgi:hypothetical protein